VQWNRPIVRYFCPPIGATLPRVREPDHSVLNRFTMSPTYRFGGVTLWLFPQFDVLAVSEDARQRRLKTDLFSILSTSFGKDRNGDPKALRTSAVIVINDLASEMPSRRHA